MVVLVGCGVGEAVVWESCERFLKEMSISSLLRPEVYPHMGKLTSRVEQSDTPNVVRIKGQRSSLCERWLISGGLEEYLAGMYRL